MCLHHILCSRRKISWPMKLWGYWQSTDGIEWCRLTEVLESKSTLVPVEHLHHPMQMQLLCFPIWIGATATLPENSQIWAGRVVFLLFVYNRGTCESTTVVNHFGRLGKVIGNKIPNHLPAFSLRYRKAKYLISLIQLLMRLSPPTPACSIQGGSRPKGGFGLSS